MGDLTDSLATSSPFEITPTPVTSSAAARNPRPMPMRDDCWSEDATFTLIEAWGKHYLDLHRGNLRQKHWQEVSDAVNANHAGFNEKARRTDVQCKNRIDTLKKKYKTEKARVLDSNGSYQSNWPFFSPLDSLIGSSPSALKTPSPASISHSSFYPTAASVALQAYEMVGARAGPPMAVPLLPFRSTLPPAGLATLVPQKRHLPVATPVAAEYTNIRNYHSTVAAEYPNIRNNHSTMAAEYPDIRNNYSTMAAAAAAIASDEEEEEDAEEEEVEEDFNEPRAKRDQEDPGGLRRLATAIESFAGVYARVEAEKQRQMVELEKQRMQFAKELECQRMQMLVEMQVQLQKVKRVRR